MLYRTINQLSVIEERDADSFQAKYNAEMQRLAKWAPRGTFNITPGSYSAIIEYAETMSIPEDVRDEFELNGVSYVCGLCPHFKLPEDKRVKKILCKASGQTKLCDSNSGACLWLYEQIARGEVEL